MYVSSVEGPVKRRLRDGAASVLAASVESVLLLAHLAAALAMLLPGFSPAPVQPSAGTVLEGTFPGTMRPGILYLPPGYNVGHRYPVVYLLHGMPGSPTEYLYGTDLPGWAAGAIAGDAVRPFIAVIPAAGPDPHYNGEWAGPWETVLVHRVVPWVDRHLSTVASASGRVLAGLSAGGYGAVDIALRNPSVFGRVESWSGYFRPLHDGPFKHATRAQLAANDPVLLARADAATLRRDHLRFFVTTGPSHSHWFKASETFAFANELRSLGLPVHYAYYPSAKGEWREQFDDGMVWALSGGGTFTSG